MNPFRARRARARATRIFAAVVAVIGDGERLAMGTENAAGAFVKPFRRGADLTGWW